MAMQQRKAIDPSTSSACMCAPRHLRLLIMCAAALYNALNLLVDALTGLERILTTPIPFSWVQAVDCVAVDIADAVVSYSVHLWVVTIIYVFLLVRPPFMEPNAQG
jgi:hypothetical protein